ncbi:MAG: cobalt-precorrin-5B (C(1))-methyltransferase CbiD [Methanomassiliicoccaceae archaeon]|nr:cobalt-precorrin-5B (C(1))-methyltransferase CbiD [Methanomassiliicoccaceae archaeon]
MQERKLRCGHTTGTCAAAAAKAALMMLFSQMPVNAVMITTPNGTALHLNIEDGEFSEGSASCAVRKDGGDDTDCTHGTLVYAHVLLSEEGITISGGRGVGTVTKKGLDQPVGSAAINSTPRRMISDAVRDLCDKYSHKGGVSVVISVPEGEELAKGTFNPRLGIVGGISIIGTSGIVEPMSERAIIDTMKVEMNVRMSSGSKYLLVVPGNYGKDFVSSYPGLDDDAAIKCSNFIGEALDASLELGAEGILFVGNIGKMVKVAGGIMNTHSKYADCRMEILASCSLLAGMGNAEAAKILSCITADDALDIISDAGKMKDVMDIMAQKIGFHMNSRVRGKVRTGAMIFSSRYGELCRTDGADDLIRCLEGGQ